MSLLFRSWTTARSGGNFSGCVGVRFPGGRLDLLGMTAGANRNGRRGKMAARHGSSAKLPVSEELVITRVLDAPREAVWNAWTDPTRFMLWWGPKGFLSPACKIDLRVGGKYLACMRSPEGQDYWSTGVYREIVPMERLVCTDSFADAKGNVVPASHYAMQGDWAVGNAGDRDVRRRWQQDENDPAACWDSTRDDKRLRGWMEWILR